MGCRESGTQLPSDLNAFVIRQAANPSKQPNGGGKLTTRAAGFGVVRFNKPTREITFECWPRNADVTDPATRQYDGWPKTIQQTDNYGREAFAYLPTLLFEGQQNPVVQVIDEDNEEIVYTLRVLGASFRPHVFQPGTYTVVVGEGDGGLNRLRDPLPVDSTPDWTAVLRSYKKPFSSPPPIKTLRRRATPSSS